MGAFIAGTGRALPSRVVGNQKFEGILDTSDEWISSRTGIRTRHFAAPHENSATLAMIAAQQALDAASVSPKELGFIVCGTVTPERMTPSNAAFVQAALGCPPIPAFDVSAACSGFLFALSIADRFMRAGGIRHALVLGSEVLSRTLDFTDRASCILFGDGAGAVVLSGSPDPERGLLWTMLAADGKHGDLIQVPSSAGGGSGLASPPATRLPHTVLNGREVFKFAVKAMCRCLQEAVSACGIGFDEVDLIVPHQVNLRVFEMVTAELGIPLGKLVLNIDRMGNTAAASIPIALDEAARQGRIRRGDVVVFVAFGGGLTWSAAVARW